MFTNLYNRRQHDLERLATVCSPCASAHAKWGASDWTGLKTTGSIHFALCLFFTDYGRLDGGVKKVTSVIRSSQLHRISIIRTQFDREMWNSPSKACKWAMNRQIDALQLESALEPLVSY